MQKGVSPSASLTPAAAGGMNIFQMKIDRALGMILRKAIRPLELFLNSLW